MRKLLLSLVCMAFMTGLVIAADYTIVSYDKDKKVVTLKDKDGNKSEGKLEGVEKRLSSDKAVGGKLDATIVDGVITEVTTKKKK